jgi:hypothetical protein
MWGELYENYHYRTDFFFIIMNYEGFQTNWVICINFSSMGH